jgi:hypothetical protein
MNILIGRVTDLVEFAGKRFASRRFGPQTWLLFETHGAGGRVVGVISRQHREFYGVIVRDLDLRKRPQLLTVPPQRFLRTALELSSTTAAGRYTAVHIDWRPPLDSSNLPAHDVVGGAS